MQFILQPETGSNEMIWPGNSDHTSLTSSYSGLVFTVLQSMKAVSSFISKREGLRDPAISFPCSQVTSHSSPAATSGVLVTSLATGGLDLPRMCHSDPPVSLEEHFPVLLHQVPLPEVFLSP